MKTKTINGFDIYDSFDEAKAAVGRGEKAAYLPPEKAKELAVVNPNWAENAAKDIKDKFNKLVDDAVDPPPDSDMGKLDAAMTEIHQKNVAAMEKTNKEWTDKNTWAPSKEAPIDWSCVGAGGQGKVTPAQHEPGAKLDQGKPDVALLLDFSKALNAVGEVSTYGANKYSRGGWQSVPDGIHRYQSAMLRHLFASRYEERDAESGLPHLACVAWNALGVLELTLRESAPASSSGSPSASCSPSAVPASGQARS